MRADRTLIALAAGFLVAGLFFTSRPAMAASHHHRHFRHVAHSRRPHQIMVASLGGADEGWFTPFPQADETRRYSGGSGSRPTAWCGWEMRRLVGGDPGPAYNLARNWAHWGRSGPAGIGAVVVWPHHVGKIVGQQNGEWVIESGNDGHALRTRPRSIRGAIAIRWG